MRSSPSAIAAASSAETIFCRASMAACALEPSISSRHKRRSNPIEALISAITAAGPPLNRPPHNAFAGRSTALAGAGLPGLLRLSFGIGCYLEVAPVRRVHRRVLIGIAAAVLALTAAGAVAFFQTPPEQRADAPPALAGSFSDFTANEAPSPAPEVAFTADGKPTSLADFHGRVVLLNFWATWCGPCVAEMPSLDRLEAELGGGEFIVVAVSEDRDEAVVDPFFADHKIQHLAHFHDPKGALASAFGVRGLPTSAVIDREGNVVGRIEGSAEWDSSQAKALIRHYIGNASTQAQL